jgi:hypothetical protein
MVWSIHTFHILDLIAIVLRINQIVNIDTRNGSVDKREICLIDETGYCISLTLWGKNVSLSIKKY